MTHIRTGLTRSPSIREPENPSAPQEIDLKSRKGHLFIAASQIHPRRILEVGVCPGHTALALILEAQKHVAQKSDVTYYGLDLFGPMTTQEFDGTAPLPLEQIQAKLESTGAEIHLIKGDSKVTLPEFVKTAEPMDLIYIDGGHSYATVSSDWEYARRLMKPGTVFVFDDYWDRLEAGCRKVVGAIDRSKYAVEICEPGEFLPANWHLAPSYICRAVKVLLR